MFASTGEGVKDFEVFHPDRMASRILDMGDVLTLTEQAERLRPAPRAGDGARFAQEDFTFDDFLQQMAAIKKMGSLEVDARDDAGHGPDVASTLTPSTSGVRPGVEAMVQSMTPFERTPPSRSARAPRIAKGSGVTASEVNALLERFGEAQKMMSRARGGGIPGMLGGGAGKKGRQPAPQRKKSKSGNPAKGRRRRESAAKGGAASAPRRARHDWTPAPLTPPQPPPA